MTDQELTKIIKEILNSGEISVRISMGYKSAMENFSKWTNPWRYLMERFPLKPSEMGGTLPPAMKKILQENGSPGAFNGVYVAFSLDNLINMLYIPYLVKLAKSKSLTTPRDVKELVTHTIDGYKPISKEVESILAHEYAHVILEHTRRAHLWEQESERSETERNAFIAATEIEANRAYGVDTDSTMYKYAAFTDEKYPKVCDMDNFWDIYQYFLEEFTNSQPQSNSSSPSSQSKSDNHSKEENSASAESHPSEGEGGTDNPLQETVQEALSRLKKEFELNSSLSDPDRTLSDALGIRPFHEPQVGNPFGMGGDSKPTLSANDRLDLFVKGQRQRSLEMALSKIRSNFKGQVTKSKTPSYSRISRRPYQGDLIRKGKKPLPTKSPSILIALDASGSMSSSTIKNTTEKLCDVVETIGRKTDNCYICMHRSYVEGTTKLSNYKELLSRYSPTGGNEFSNVLDEARRLKVDVVLNVGDGLDHIHRFQPIPPKPVSQSCFAEPTPVWIDVIVTDFITSTVDHSPVYWRTVKEDNYPRQTIILGKLSPKPSSK